MCNKCNINEKHGRSGMCKPCKNAYNKEHYENNKQYYIDKANTARKKMNQEIDALKEANPCMDCYESFPACCMDFDHLADKEFDVSKGINYSRERLMAEIAKCDIICSNCHRLRTRHRNAHKHVVKPITPADKAGSVYFWPCSRPWCGVV